MRGMALGVGVAFPLLALFGFNPRGLNGPGELHALTALYSIVPVTLWIASLLPVWNFPITPERQAELREAIGRRTARGVTYVRRASLP